MKKIILIVLSFILALGCLCGCGGGQSADGLRIVCTIFPVYDWMRELTAGADVELILIADNGVDMHSYQPTTGDIVDISTCDMLVGVGGESEEWLAEVLDRSGREDTLVVELLDAMGGHALENSTQLHDHDHGGHDHDCVLDEHVWLSPANARTLCAHLTGQLMALDADNAALYEANGAEYAQRLSALDEQYRQAAQEASAGALLFADRFPFRYLTNDYGIEYYAAFDGCSAETEASFETVAQLSSALEQHELDCVLIIEGSEDSLARTIIDGSGRGDCAILSVDSMQSVTAQDMENGVTYIGIMEENLSVFRQALGCE